MKYFVIIPFFVFGITISAFASESKGGTPGVDSTHQTPHPPHDHHDPDHMKYITRRGDDTSKKRKSEKSKV